MSDPAQTALDFCQMCLGWEHPVDRRFAETSRSATGKGPSQAWTPYIFDFYGKNPQFHYTDLNAVMEAVKAWCDKHRESLDVYYVPSPTAIWHVSVGPDPVENPDLCYALLAACVDAIRRINRLAPP